MMRGGLPFFFLAALAAFGGAYAQVPDPTRPPAAAMEPEAAGGPAMPVESGVQTVILRPGGKSAAVIDGKYVSVGDMVGDKRVQKISESEVILKGPGGREVIKVMPAIEKVPANKKAAAKRRTTGTTQ